MQHLQFANIVHIYLTNLEKKQNFSVINFYRRFIWNFFAIFITKNKF